MSNIKNVSTGYTSRPLQAQIHRELKRFSVLILHRRFGKTVLSINELIDRSLNNQLKNPQYAYIAPTFGQAKRVAWDYLKEYTRNLPNVTTHEGELRVDIDRPHLKDRIRIVLLGSENPEAIRGMYFDGVVMDEFADMNPEVWTKVVRPALSDRLGWALFIGTPKGRNHLYDIFQVAKQRMEEGLEWYAKVFKSSETGIIARSELEEAKALMSEEEFEQEFECSFSAALVGAYYGKAMDEAERQSRIGSVLHDPSVLVDTYWDLGISDTNVIWIGQQVGKEYHWIDYIESNGQGLDWYVKQMKEGDRNKYNYGTHYLPHDAAARELGTGKTRQETLRSLGLRNTIIVPRQSVEDGINASRIVIAKSWFDAKKCYNGIEALKNYQKKWDAKNKTYMGQPKHDWASHAADAFRTAAMARRDNGPSQDSLSRLPRKTVSEYSIF